MFNLYVLLLMMHILQKIMHKFGVKGGCSPNIFLYNVPGGLCTSIMPSIKLKKDKVTKDKVTAQLI